MSYWAVPAGCSTALPGRWRPGPGRALFGEVSRQLGRLPFVAEDLGVITPAVRRLRDALGLPGMLVLQLAFEPRERASPHRLERHSQWRFVYTGTHDNDTLRGWYESLDRPRLRLLQAALSSKGIALGEEPWWGLIRLAFSSPALVAMVQAQDLLGLGSEARMNDPGRPRRRANWHWRLPPGALTPALAARLREVTDEAGRGAG